MDRGVWNIADIVKSRREASGAGIRLGDNDPNTYLDNQFRQTYQVLAAMNILGALDSEINVMG